MSTHHQSSQSSFSQKEILQEIEGILTGRWITDLSNISAILMSRFNDINWVGFYLVQEDPQKLYLGPFQGLPACTEIPFSKGVCGAAASTRKSFRVDNVDEFPGHIVCDSRSKSEVVVPLIKNDKILGVLDVDSANIKRFTDEDVLFFEKVVNLLLDSTKSDFI